MRDLTRTRWSLVLAAKEGNAQAIDTFVLRYRQAVVNYIAMRGLKSEAEDVAQEVFISLFQKGALDRVDPVKGRFRTWLFVVTRHVINRFLERKHAQKRGGGKTIGPLEVDVAAPLNEEAFDREWFSNLLSLALNRLEREHPNYHAAIKAFLLQERSHQEIAAAMGKTKGDVKNYVYRGKRKLIAYLQEEVWSYSTSRGDYEAEIRYLSKFLP